MSYPTEGQEFKTTGFLGVIGRSGGVEISVRDRIALPHLVYGVFFSLPGVGWKFSM